MEKIAALIAAITILINVNIPMKSYKATDVWITDESEIPGYIYTYYETSFEESYVRLPAVLGDESDINYYIRNVTYDRYEKTFKQFENGTYDDDLIWQIDYKISCQVNGLNVISIQVATGYSGEEFDIIYHTFYYEVENDIVFSAEEYLAEFGYDVTEFITAFQKVAEPGFTPDYWGWDLYPYVNKNSTYMLCWGNIDWIAFDENDDLYVHYHTTEKYKNPMQVKVPIENTELGDIMRIYRKAREMYFNFTGIGLIDINSSVPLIQLENGWQYCKVQDERFKTMPKLKAYLEELFTPEYTKILLSAHKDMILERDGSLWWSNSARGSNLNVIVPYYKISRKTADTMILTERTASRDDYDNNIFPGKYSYHEYELKLIDGEWKFNTFPCPWGASAMVILPDSN